MGTSARAYPSVIIKTTEKKERIKIMEKKKSNETKKRTHAYTVTNYQLTVQNKVTKDSIYFLSNQHINAYRDAMKCNIAWIFSTKNASKHIAHVPLPIQMK